MVTGAILISTQATSVRASNIDGLLYRHPDGFAHPGRKRHVGFWGDDKALWLASRFSVLSLLLARVGSPFPARKPCWARN